MNFNTTNTSSPKRELFTQQIPPSEWTTVDLKIFLALLTLSEPSITQNNIAKSLRISPVTLSRIVNSNDRKIRDTWIPVLSEYLSKIDMNSIYDTVCSLYKIDAINKHHVHMSRFIPIIEDTISRQGFDYKFDPNYWGLSNGIIRFVNSIGQSWLFTFGNPNDGNQWRLSRSGIGPFSYLKRLQHLATPVRASIIYQDADSFGFSVKMSYTPYKVSDCQYYLSLFLYNSDYNRIEEEYIVSAEQY